VLVGARERRRGLLRGRKKAHPDPAKGASSRDAACQLIEITEHDTAEDEFSG
jgi:hypothetical protein